MGLSARVALSAQNGGAAISLNLDDGEMAVLQVEPPMSRSSNREKLSAGCAASPSTPAAPRRRAPPRRDRPLLPRRRQGGGRTKVTSPIDVKVDMRENELLVGCSSKTHLQVLAFAQGPPRRVPRVARPARPGRRHRRRSRYGGEAEEERRQRQAEGGADVRRPAAVHPAGMACGTRLQSSSRRGARSSASTRRPPVEAAVIEGSPRPGAPADQRRVLTPLPFAVSPGRALLVLVVLFRFRSRTPAERVRPCPPPSPRASDFEPLENHSCL